MPQIRHYTVTETREVKVVANSPADAVQIAASAFALTHEAHSGVSIDGVWGNTSCFVRVTDISANEEI